jgi:hypothetical protein
MDISRRLGMLESISETIKSSVLIPEDYACQFFLDAEEFAFFAGSA